MGHVGGTQSGLEVLLKSPPSPCAFQLFMEFSESRDEIRRIFFMTLGILLASEKIFSAPETLTHNLGKFLENSLLKNLFPTFSLPFPDSRKSSLVCLKYYAKWEWGTKNVFFLLFSKNNF